MKEVEEFSHRGQDDGRRNVSYPSGSNKNSLGLAKITLLRGRACKTMRLTRKVGIKAYPAISVTFSVSDLRNEPDPWTAKRRVTKNEITSPELPNSLFFLSSREYFIVKLRTIVSSSVSGHSLISLRTSRKILDV